VWPSRTKGTAPAPKGGAVRISPQLQTIFDDNLENAKFTDQPAVVFNVDPATRTSDVRDDVMRFAFGNSAAARAAALDLAQRLSQAMDLRSSSALFVPAAYRQSGLRHVVLWVFPSEDALQIRPTPGGASIEVLREVFSQKSKLRKAAHFAGRDKRTDFLEGKVLDYQASALAKEVATFWIDRFLSCTLAVKDDAGSRMIARALRRVHEHLEKEDREQLHVAAIAVRRTPHKRMSFFGFANRYLEGNVKTLFLSECPSPDALMADFDFNRKAFDELCHFRVFELTNGVYVSAPLAEVGQTVRLRGNDHDQLACEGVVVDEKMRARHA
jgi:hypothetical protein